MITIRMSPFLVLVIFQLYSRLSLSRNRRALKTLRDIRSSTYQICIIEEKTI